MLCGLLFMEKAELAVNLNLNVYKVYFLSMKKLAAAAFLAMHLQ